MKYRLFLTLPILMLFFIACSPGKDPVDKNMDSVFVKITEEYLEGFFAIRPAYATALGLHKYDRNKIDYSKKSLNSELTRLKYYEKKLLAINDSIPSDTRHDYNIILSSIRNEIFEFEEIESFTKNPMVYADAMTLDIFIKRNFSPLPERVKSIIIIEDQAPAIFAAARQNLEDSLAKPYVETAILIANGSIEFMENELISALKDLKDDALRKQFEISNKKAVAELRSFASWLQNEKMNKTHNHYAIGKENYKKMLLLNEMITESPEQILAMGLTELKKEQERFAQVAKKIDPSKKPVEVFEALKKEHPEPDKLILSATKNIKAIRQFLIDKKIITIPSDMGLEITETPEFERATSTASMDTPGPFEKDNKAFYYITPVEKEWSPKQKEEWLSQFNYYVMDLTSIHEAYPGHYIQLLKLNASSASKIQKIFGSYAFIEGWAHYTEQMMIEEGFGASDPIVNAKYHLAQLNESLLRLCRLCVSIKTHTQGMSLADATKFFQDNCYYDYKPAYQEALRGTFDPGYLFYTLGKLQILKLRDDYKKQEGVNFSLLKFHDELLNHGAPPLKIMREIMLKKPEEISEF